LDTSPLDSDVAQIIARLDRSSPDKLLNSIAEELLRLHRAYQAVVARMHALEITQSTYDQMISSGEPLALQTMPQAAIIDASFSLSTEAGFYHLEYDSLGVPYRWTGPEPTFLFELFIDRQLPAAIRLRFSQATFAHSRRTVRCYVDGHEIATALVDVDGEFEVRGMLPPRDLVGGSVLSFVCPSVSAPDGQQDIRLLGLVFRWLRIEAVPAAAADTDDAHGSPVVALQRESKANSPGKLRRRIKSVGDASSPSVTHPNREA
jgi:hypothetical protein